MKDILPQELPTGWRQLPLEPLVTRMSNGISKRQTKDGNGLPVSRIETISQGIVDLNRVGYLADLDSDEIRKYQLECGDILFSHINSDLHLGKTAVFAMEGQTLIHGMNLLLIRVDRTKLLPAFLHCLFNYYRTAGLFMSIAQHAVNQSSINQRKLNALPIIVPPLPEQRRIVAEIEKQFTRLEAGVAALRRVQANLKRYRAAVLKAACEGQLVPTEAELQKSAGRGQKKFETGEQLLQRILAERRKNWEESNRRSKIGNCKYREPAAPDTANLPPLPEGWTWATFEQISERVTVGFVGSMKHEYVPSGIPFLRGQNVRENKFDPDGLLYVSPAFHQKLSKSAIQPGDLAVVRSGSVGVTCVIPDTLPEANCSDLVLIQRPLGFVPQYGAYFMNSLAKRHVEAGKVGVALTHFNTKSVAAMVVPLPPVAEQTRIVAEVERRLSVVEELESVVSANLQRANRLRQSILQKAFTGELLEFK